MRRTDDVPTRAPSLRSAMRRARVAISASRGSSRGSTAAMAMPGARCNSMSFMEWTARSMRPSSSAASISLVNRPLPPTSASGRSVTASPEVRIARVSTRARLGQAPDGRRPGARAPRRPGRAPGRCRACRGGGAPIPVAWRASIGASAQALTGWPRLRKGLCSAAFGGDKTAMTRKPRIKQADAQAARPLLAAAPGVRREASGRAPRPIAGPRRAGPSAPPRSA